MPVVAKPHIRTMVQDAGSPARPVMPPSGPLRLPDPPAPARIHPSKRFTPPSQAATMAEIDGSGNATTLVAGDLVDVNAPPPGPPPIARPSSLTQPQPISQPIQQPPQQPPMSADVFPSGPSGPDPRLISPVGPQFPQQVDWKEAALEPARALPTWVMVMLFLVASGLALGVTFLVTKALR
jgi:hypothetical protein